MEGMLMEAKQRAARERYLEATRRSEDVPGWEMADGGRLRYLDDGEMYDCAVPEIQRTMLAEIRDAFSPSQPHSGDQRWNLYIRGKFIGAHASPGVLMKLAEKLLEDKNASQRPPTERSAA
jgi:hypothetical protein